MNRERLSKNTRPRANKASGAVREGAALLQGIATCACCGRRLRVYYQGRNATPGYYCANSNIVSGRGERCLRVGGARIDSSVSAAFLETIAPAGIQAAIQAEESIEADHDHAVAQWRLQVEQARYRTQQAERRYRAVDPENRLVARTLEADWNLSLNELATAEAELESREQQRPTQLSDEQRAAIHNLGEDLNEVWQAQSTTDRDRKELLRTLVEEVIIDVKRDQPKPQAHLTMRWRGGLFTKLDVDLWHAKDTVTRTDEDTIDLIRRLAVHYPDATIAGILNRQGRKSARGLSFTANRVGNLRRHWKITRFEAAATVPEGEPITVAKAAEVLGVAPSTVHRWVNDGFIPAEQLTPGAPWRIRMNEAIKSRFVESTPEGYVPMIEATKILGVTRQTILHRVKSGELEAVHLSRGRRKGLRIKVLDDQPELFNSVSSEGV